MKLRKIEKYEEKVGMLCVPCRTLNKYLHKMARSSSILSLLLQFNSIFIYTFSPPSYFFFSFSSLSSFFQFFILFSLFSPPYVFSFTSFLFNPFPLSFETSHYITHLSLSSLLFNFIQFIFSLYFFSHPLASNAFSSSSS